MAIEKAKNIPPFVRFCTASVPMVFDNSMSYYECLCALTNFMQKELVEVVNNNADLLAELNVKFDELKKYVDEYFDNLDVQEEINNKLDEMAEGGELATIIAQFLEMAPVFAYGTIANMAAAENLNEGCIARVLGNTSAAAGDGAYYQIRARGVGETADGYYKVDITADNSIIAERVINADAEELRLNEFNQINLYQNLIYNTDTTKSYQGCCVDDNGVLYQYENTNSQNGNLYKFNLNTQTYIAKIENVPFYHGGSLAYKDGYIYASAWGTSDTPSNKIVKYNVSAGTSDEYQPFSSSLMTRSAALGFYGDKLFVCGAVNSSAVHLGAMNFALVDTTDNSYVQYTLVNNKHFNLSDNVVSSLACDANKMYVMTATSNALFELIIDDVNHTLTVNKVYTLKNLNDLGLEIGELEGMAPMPVSYNGRRCYALTSFMYQASGTTACSLYVNNFCVDSDLAPTTIPLGNQYYPNKRLYITVNKTGGSSLKEDGTTTNPFRSLRRAMEFAANAQARGLSVAEISITDAQTYPVGSISNMSVVINANANAATIQFDTIQNCNVAIKGANVIVDKVSSASNIYMTDNTNFFADYLNCACTISATHNTMIASYYVTITASAQDWLTLNTSQARLNILAADNITRNVVNNRDASLLLINDEFKNKVYTDRVAYKIVGSTS